jgi:miniconductance mechanosensitive channel
MVQEKTFLLHWMSQLLDLLGLNSSDGGYRSMLASVVVVMTCVVVWLLLRYILLRARRLKDYIDSPLEVILTKRNMEKVASVVAIFIFYMLLPLAFDAATPLGVLVRKALDVMIVWILASVVNMIIRTIFAVVGRKHQNSGAPLKGFMQILQLIVWLLAIIFIVGVLVDKSPVKLITGLGASLAVLSFVFKDTILNLVSGILLSSDKMIKVGDWIEMPSAGIDGVVVDMTLNTVKVQGWDNTISNVSPYTLTSGTFKNWHGMFASGGRRIARSVEIDINTVKFCPADLIERIGKLELMRDYVASLPEPRTQQTNLGLFRQYLTFYLEAQPWLNKSMYYMVRHLQSSDTGVPLQIYAFSNDTAWVNYEGIQAALFEHIMAIAPLFELKIFQRPSGADLEKRGVVDEIIKDIV